jgi:hypothetical protein
MKKTCLHCGKEFDAPKSGIERGQHKYCSVKCYSEARDTRITKSCIICEREFITSPRLISMGGGICCSLKCSGVYRHSTHSITKICENCGKTFTIHKCHLDRTPGKYCSAACSSEGRKKRNQKHCLICGKTIYPSPSQIKSGGGKYCSIKCFHESDEVRDILRVASSGRTGELASNWRGGQTKRTCLNCGDIILLYPSRIKMNSRFCSTLCSNNYNKRCGVESPQWKGGISFEPYCPKFNKEFKERVRAFFNHTCVECATPQTVKKLHVHHVNFNKESCCDPSIPLFVPLCDSCHGKTNFNRGFWTYWFTEMITRHYGVLST